MRSTREGGGGPFLDSWLSPLDPISRRYAFIQYWTRRRRKGGCARVHYKLRDCSALIAVVREQVWGGNCYLLGPRDPGIGVARSRAPEDHLATLPLDHSSLSGYGLDGGWNQYLDLE